MAILFIFCVFYIHGKFLMQNMAILTTYHSKFQYESAMAIFVYNFWLYCSFYFSMAIFNIYLPWQFCSYFVLFYIHGNFLTQHKEI